MKELIIKKCMSCGATVEVLQDCNCGDCGIQCCGKNMLKLEPNSTDAAVEKHVPEYEIQGEMVNVKVNHVMDEEHFIEWIAIVGENNVCKKMLNPGEIAEVKFEYIPGSILYAYCNKHGLWKKEGR